MPIFNSDMEHTLSEEMLEDERKLIASMYRDLLRSFKSPLNEDDQKLVREAFEMAAEAHKIQRRKDGTPYITHPIAVARICVEEIGLGPTAAACALLHDVVEDTDFTLDDIRERFPDKVQPEREKGDKKPKIASRIATIVDGLTKLDSLHEHEYPQAENIRRVLEAMLSDVRVILIKMADRLHNLRTIASMKPEKQLKIATETDSIYTPLAHQLGLYKVKTEFQDNCLKITNRQAYDDIAKKLAQTKSSREAYIESFIEPIKNELEEYGLQATVYGRPKSIHSIYEKMTKKKVEFENIYDLLAIRIVLDVNLKQEKMQCWQAYAIVTDCYKPIPERQKDWLSNPKTNGYESLHISVVGPDGKFVEVQIRSNRMDEIAERGFAAHWKYKGVQGFGSKAQVFDKWIADLRETLKDQSNPVEFIADLQAAIYVEDIVQVFTPKGDIKALPKGATALDFAFSVHSDIGCTCQIVKVDGVLQPFNYKVQTGEQVEIITNRNQKPTEDWLLFVVTSKARTRIKVALNEEKRKLAEQGKEILERKLNNMHKVGAEENIDYLAKCLHFPNRLEFLCAIALGKFQFSLLKPFRPDGKLLVMPEPEAKPDDGAPPSEVGQPHSARKERKFAKTKSQAVIINDEPGVYYSYEFANCCSPQPGEAIFAYLNANKAALIHTATCKNAKYLLTNYAFRFLRAEWGNVIRDRYATELIITGRDVGRGVIREISECIERLGINMQSFSMSGDDGLFQGNVILEVSTPEHLNLAISALKNFEFVTSVEEHRLEM